MEMFNKFTNLSDHYFHLITGSRRDADNFCGRLTFYDPSKFIVRMIRGRKALTVNDLYNEFAAALQFPYYFGENWAAFDECINDLGWIPSVNKIYPAKAYILIISDIDKVLLHEEADFKILITILKNTVKEWTEGRNYNPSFPTPPTPFHIVFHCEEDKKISALKQLTNAELKDIAIHEIEHDEIL